MPLPIMVNVFTTFLLQVKSRDREFDSVPHLVKFFSENEIPLLISNKEVFLATPVPHH